VKGWKWVAKFVGEPVSVVERWLSQATPVFKMGRFVTSTPATSPNARSQIPKKSQRERCAPNRERFPSSKNVIGELGSIHFDFTPWLLPC